MPVKKTFNVTNLSAPGSAQRFSRWKKVKNHEISIDGFNFKVRELGSEDKDAPVFVYLSGGPGSNNGNRYKTLFAPKNSVRFFHYDMRGCGNNHTSDFLAEKDDRIKRQEFFNKSINDNHTDALISDIELIRQKFTPETKINLYGLSWGATVAIRYAQQYPDSVASLTLTSPLLDMPEYTEMTLAKNGLHANKHPEEYLSLLSTVGIDVNAISNNPLEISEIYFRALTSTTDLDLQKRALHSWNRWENIRNNMDPGEGADHINETQLYRAILMVYYFNKKFFLPEEGLVTNLDAIKNIPIKVIANSLDPIIGSETINYIIKNIPHAEIVDIPRVCHFHSCNMDISPIDEKALVEEIAALKSFV